MKTLTIVIEGGLIQNVLLSEPIEDLQVLVIDYDYCETGEAECFTMIPQKIDEKEIPAYASMQPIVVAHPTIQQDIDKVLYRVENGIHPTEEEL